MNWTDLSPEARDFIIRVTMELVKQTGRAAAEFLIDEFQKTFQEPEKRVISDLNRLSAQIASVKKAPKWYQVIRRPRAERRDLLRLVNLLNLVRSQMVRQRAFYFMPLPTKDREIVVLFQTSRSYLSRPTIDSMGVWVASRETTLRDTKPWTTQGPQVMTFNDIEGATNSTLFIRWMTVADLQAYVPFLKQTDPSRNINPGDVDENNHFTSLGNSGRRFLCLGKRD